MSGAQSGDPFNRWAAEPYFDYLEPAPWSMIRQYLWSAVAVLAVSLTTAIWVDGSGHTRVRRVARSSWALGLGLAAYSGWLAMPRDVKLGMMVFGGGTLGLFFLAGSTIWMYGGITASPKESEGDEKEAGETARSGKPADAVRDSRGASEDAEVTADL